jgi:hypothetical protein
VLDRPEAEAMAAVFAAGEAEGVTTERDAGYLSWRYLEAPYREELSFIVGGSGEAPDVVAVLRVTETRNGRVARLLDIFGRLDDEEVVRDVLGLVLQRALSLGACQVTAMASSRALARHLRRAAFAIRRRGRFCARSEDRGLYAAVEGPALHLVLGDSDNDEA